jgi:hypothetical protein
MYRAKYFNVCMYVIINYLINNLILPNSKAVFETVINEMKWQNGHRNCLRKTLTNLNNKSNLLTRLVIASNPCTSFEV